MPCAHGATRHSPGADRTRPTDLLARHGSTVGGGTGPSRGRSGEGTAGPGRSAGAPDPIAHLAAVCRDAEQLGADALWACDHLFWHGPSLESMMALAVAATATHSAMLGTCVIQLPLRQAPVVAKQAASLQTLTRGRFILGVGVGSHAGEYEQAGRDYHSRGRQLDAGIGELRRSWASGGGVTAGDTAAEGADRYRQLPEPPAVPVWVGRLLGSSPASGRHPGRWMDAALPQPRRVPRSRRATGARRSTGPGGPPMRHPVHRPVRLPRRRPGPGHEPGHGVDVLALRHPGQGLRAAHRERDRRPRWPGSSPISAMQGPSMWRHT